MYSCRRKVSLVKIMKKFWLWFILATISYSSDTVYVAFGIQHKVQQHQIIVMMKLSHGLHRTVFTVASEIVRYCFCEGLVQTRLDIWEAQILWD